MKWLNSYFGKIDDERLVGRVVQGGISRCYSLRRREFEPRISHYLTGNFGPIV